MATISQKFRGWFYRHIATSTTTVVKSGHGLLYAVCINNPGTTATVTVYDNTAASGTVIAVFGGLAGSSRQQFEVPFTVGCTVVTTGAPDLTVLFQ